VAFYDQALQWWLDGTGPTAQDPAHPNDAWIDQPGGGGFWPTETFANYYAATSGGNTLASADNYFQLGYGWSCELANLPPQAESKDIL